MNTPQERAIARFVKSQMSDTTSYVPLAVHKDMTFSRRDARTGLFQPYREQIEDNLADDLEKAILKEDTVAYLHVLDELVKVEKKYMYLYCNSPKKPAGNYYDHEFEYKNREGHTQTMKANFRVYDSMNVVKPEGTVNFQYPLN